MDWCEVDGCESTVNRDGLCFRHKVQTLRFNTARLAAYREANVTSEGLKKEIFEGARESGRDIQQKRGRRRPHETFKNGEWVSA